MLISQLDPYTDLPPPPPLIAPGNTENNYRERVIQFLRQPDIFDQLEERSRNDVPRALRSGVNLCIDMVLSYLSSIC